MKTPFLSKRQFNKIKHFLPDQRRAQRLNDREIISGILWVIWHGLPWRQVPEIYGKWNTIYRRFARWSKAGIFENIFQALGYKIKKRIPAMMDSTFAKLHRTAASLKADGLPRQLGRSSGGMTTKIHIVANVEGKPLAYCITPGNVADIKVAPAMIEANHQRMKSLIADKAYDSDMLRCLLESYRICACIPPKSNRKTPVSFDRKLYEKRHVIENMFAKIKDWRGVATRYCRCAHTYSSFVALALTYTFFIVH